jgi:long-chain fatty acid transport protein
VKKHVGLVLCLALSLGLAPLAHGSGFLIYEHGAAAMGMAGAFVSIGNNATTVFHNPAGMSWLGGTQISVGGTIIVPKGSLSLPNWPVATYKNVKQVDQTFLAPNFYLTHKFGKKFAAGIAVFAPYGLGTKWPVEYPLRYVGTSNDMQTIFVNPSISYLINDNLSIGGGVSYIYSRLSLSLTRLVEIGPYWTGDVPATLDDANGSAVAFNLGVLYKTGTWSFGAAWRGAFDIKYKGDIALDTAGVPAPFKSFVPTTGSVETTFRFPDIFTVGASFKPLEDLTVAVDAQYYTWNRYDKYVITITYPAGFAPAAPETVLENWKNTWLFRFGLQYQLNESLVLRGGIMFDQTPQPAISMDPNLPDANRVALTAGIGYKIGRIMIDAAYQYEKFSDRMSPNRGIYPFSLGEGTYKTTGHLFGVSLGYAF